MSLETLKSELNELVEKAKSDFLSKLEDDANWDWMFSSKDDDEVWIETKDRKYSAFLRSNGDLVVRFSDYTLFREEAPRKLNRLIAFFTKKTPVEPSSLAKRLREIDAIIETRKTVERMERQLRWAKEAFEK